jgi:hypothetical protein
MQFIRTGDDVLYPVNRIEAIKIKREERTQHVDVMVLVENEDQWQRTSLTERQLTLVTSTIIVPAERYSVITYTAADEHGGEMTEIIPIIAFALTPDGDVEPLGLNGLDLSTDVGIVHPDGRIEISGDGAIVDTIEAFKNVMRKWAEKQRQWAKEDAAKAPVSVVG